MLKCSPLVFHGWKELIHVSERHKGEQIMAWYNIRAHYPFTWFLNGVILFLKYYDLSVYPLQKDL